MSAESGRLVRRSDLWIIQPNWQGGIMKHIHIRLQSISDVKDFVRIANTFPCEVDLSSGRYVVDAKSMMGLLSLDLTKPVTVTIHRDIDQNLIDQLKPFVTSVLPDQTS